MSAFQNLDLLSVGIAIATIGILGFVVFLNNRKSTTNRAFFYFAIAAATWSIFNYAYYQPSQSPEITLWLLRLHAFFAIWYTFFLFRLFFVFPKEEFTFPKIYSRVLTPVVGVISAITLTPFVFTSITEFSAAGRIEGVQNGLGIFLFGAAILGLIVLAFGSLFLRTRRATKEERHKFSFIIAGGVITFTLHVIFNFVLPAFLDNSRYIPLGAVFIFPLIALTYYSIIRHHLLNVKVVTTEILTVLLAIVTFIEIIFATDIETVIFRAGVFSLVMSFGVLLIKGVRREIEQKEKLQTLTTDLAIANEKLKELDKQKDEFLSFASHDLKSPVSKMKQWASLIYDKTYNEEAQILDTAYKIKSTGDRAIRLVDEFLNIRKLEEGKMEYNFELKDMVTFTRGIVEDFKPVAKQKGLELNFNTSAPLLNASIDTIKMRQVIENLIDNSIKYTETGFINVTIVEEQKSILITIKDSGGGMDPAIIPTLFEQFHREAGVAKKIQGTGLGLYIAKQIMIAHHGEIWAESEGRNKGSTFHVRIAKA